MCLCVYVCIRLFVVPLGTAEAQSADKHIVAVAELADFGLVASLLLGANYFVFCSIHSLVPLCAAVRRCVRLRVLG